MFHNQYQTPQQQIEFSQRQAEHLKAVRREKKVFAANLEAIAAGQVDWLELQAKLEQTFEPDSDTAA